MSCPQLSIVIAFHDMKREAPRTLHTLAASYQRGASAESYEVIAVDIGSQPPLDEAMVRSHGPNFRLLRSPRAPSPAAAINAAVRDTSAESVMVCIDGARMLTPGIVSFSLAALRGFGEALIATLSWHLGPKVQNVSMLEGYEQTIEDRLLATVDWQRNGYELFRIGCLAQSSLAGWLGPIGESNCLTLSRTAWDRLGGYDERFESLGGGFVNPDFYVRACAMLGPPVLLLGEATFHQFHGGVATNTPRYLRPLQAMAEEYFAIRGCQFAPPTAEPLLVGGLPPQALQALAGMLQIGPALEPS
jgi:hypothetical protein